MTLEPGKPLAVYTTRKVKRGPDLSAGTPSSSRLLFKESRLTTSLPLRQPGRDSPKIRIPMFRNLGFRSADPADSCAFRWICDYEIARCRSQ